MEDRKWYGYALRNGKLLYRLCSGEVANKESWELKAEPHEVTETKFVRALNALAKPDPDSTTCTAIEVYVA